MRFLVVLISLLLPIPCFAEGFYLGGGLGSSSLNYNLHDWLQNQEQQYLDNQGIGFLNVPIGYQESFGGHARKIFVGYEFNKWFQAELSFKNYGTYNAKVHINTQVNQVAGPIVRGLATYSGTVNGFVVGDASAEATAKGVGLSMLFTAIHGDTANVFFRLGVEHFQANWTTQGSYNYQYNWSGTNGLTLPVTGSGSGSGTSLSTQDGIKAIAPVIGLGFDVRATKHVSLRLEAERTGDPRHSGPSIDMYTLNLLYRF